jgi:hypothetical protein
MEVLAPLIRTTNLRRIRGGGRMYEDHGVIIISPVALIVINQMRNPAAKWACLPLHRR